ncbi:peptidoglycan editing factor PgeF [Tsuneonella deserti]|nr:peptidoglycan editing factor PgeF [Tsuneonella deserti]
MTRIGGVSTGLVEGLNCGFGAEDDPAAVAENRRRAADAVLSGAALVSVHQIHSPRAVTVDEPWPDNRRPEADALVTKRQGILLGIVTADCAPVLLADRAAGVIGAAHAGWRGAESGIIEATVAAMEALGARRDAIAAAVGPCIAQASYEVGEELRERFGEAAQQFFSSGARGRWQFDLAGYVAARLAESLVGSVEVLECDTYCDQRRFYSFRRATHLGEPTYGRQVSLIGLPPEA